MAVKFTLDQLVKMYPLFDKESDAKGREVRNKLVAVAKVADRFDEAMATGLTLAEWKAAHERYEVVREAVLNAEGSRTNELLHH